MITTRRIAMRHSCAPSYAAGPRMASATRRGRCYVDGRISSWRKRWQTSAGRIELGRLRADDQRGRLNLLTPEKVRQGLAEAREGIVFCLSLPLDLSGRQRAQPAPLPATAHGRRGAEAQRNYNYALSQDDPRWSDVVCDDAVLLWTQYSTQWDALCHVGAEFDADGDGIAEQVYYNGFRAGDETVISSEALADPAPLAGPVRPAAWASRTWPRPASRAAA